MKRWRGATWPWSTLICCCRARNIACDDPLEETQQGSTADDGATRHLSRTTLFLLGINQDVALFDVRQPLDLLAHSEIIPGARRIAPLDVLAVPSLIPKDKEAIVYCTCPGDKTSRAVLRRALDLQFFKIKFLKGGFDAWKAKGYPLEPYREVFHLYSPNLGSLQATKHSNE